MIFRRFLLAGLLPLLLAAPPAQADVSLNPFDWFGGGGDARQAATPEEEKKAQSLLEKGRQALEEDDRGAANRAFKKIAKAYPTTEAAPRALFLRGKILREKGKHEKSFETFQRIVDNHPAFPDFNQVIGAQFEVATELQEGARGTILWVIPGFKQPRKAMEFFRQIVGNAPYSDYAPLALMNVALIAKKEDKPQEAIDALDRLINNYPQSVLASDAYETLADTYAGLVQGPAYDQGSTRQAISYYEDFLSLFPDSEYVGEVEAGLRKMKNIHSRSRLYLGDFYYYHRNNATAALIFYNEAIDVAPETRTADEARARIEDIEAGVEPTTAFEFLEDLLLID